MNWHEVVAKKLIAINKLYNHVSCSRKVELEAQV